MFLPSGSSTPETASAIAAAAFVVHDRAPELSIIGLSSLSADGVDVVSIPTPSADVITFTPAGPVCVHGVVAASDVNLLRSVNSAVELVPLLGRASSSGLDVGVAVSALSVTDATYNGSANFTACAPVSWSSALVMVTLRWCSSGGVCGFTPAGFVFVDAVPPVTDLAVVTAGSQGGFAAVNLLAPFQCSWSGFYDADSGKHGIGFVVDAYTPAV